MNTAVLTAERARARAVLSHPSATCFAEFAEALVASDFTAEQCVTFLDAATRDRDALIAAHRGEVAAARRTLANPRGDRGGIAGPDSRGPADASAGWSKAVAHATRHIDEDEADRSKADSGWGRAVGAVNGGRVH